MKFGQSLAVSLAALLCTGSLALAQAPDKGGMGGGAARPKKWTEVVAQRAVPRRTVSRLAACPASAVATERGMSERGQAGERSSRAARPEAQGRERAQDRAERGGRDKGQERAQRRDRDEDRAQRAGRDRDQDKAQRTARDRDQQRARDREQDRAAQSGRNKDQDRARRTDRDRDQGKAAEGRRTDKVGNYSPPIACRPAKSSMRRSASICCVIAKSSGPNQCGGEHRRHHSTLGAIASDVLGDLWLCPGLSRLQLYLLEDETICIVDPRSLSSSSTLFPPPRSGRRDRACGHL